MADAEIWLEKWCKEAGISNADLTKLSDDEWEHTCESIEEDMELYLDDCEDKFKTDYAHIIKKWKNKKE